MQITRKQIRAMILKEMAEIIPFPTASRFPVEQMEEPPEPPDRDEVMSGVARYLKIMKQRLVALADAPKLGRGTAPATTIAVDILHVTDALLNNYLSDIEILRDLGDGLAEDVSHLFNDLMQTRRRSVRYAGTDRAAAMEIGEKINNTWALLVDDVIRMYGGSRTP